MICKDKVELIKQLELENKYVFATYSIRIKTEKFEVFNQSVDFPKYSYLYPDEDYGLKMCMKPINGIITLDEILELYDKIAIRSIELCRMYDDIEKYCEFYRLRVPSNISIQSGDNDYIYKIALNVVGSAIIESEKAGLRFDKLSEEEIEYILLNNSFMIFKLYGSYASEKPDGSLRLCNVIYNLDSFITVPKHMDKDYIGQYLCS